MNDRTQHQQEVPDQSEPIHSSLLELIRTRRAKVQALREKGTNPYPYRFDRTHTIAEILANFDALAEIKQSVSVAGRIMQLRKMGKSFFIDLRDATNRIQLYVKLDNVGAELFDLVDTFDLGDIIGATGTVFVTKTNERSISLTSLQLLTKTLHPLPDKHAGLSDVEQRYRRRYVDLIVNPEVRDVFILRTKIIQQVREYLNRQGFLEVETPILQPLYGGASARPFKTHHNTLDMPMYMRIADELYLKRLIVGGYDKVWELCKDFRNEGMDRMHNPEFTMIELYCAYADYHDMADLLENMLRELVHSLHGSYKLNFGEKVIDFEPPFRKLSMLDSVKEATGVDFSTMTFEQAKAKALTMGADAADLLNWGKVVEAIWELKVEPKLVQPTFITDYPVEISPLAKRHRSNQNLTERFELFIAGSEMGNAFSELNDPVDQLQRFIQQGKAMDQGDEEAQPLDDDFITALAFGMPPTAGLGFGIDRLVMLLTNQPSIRDVILFPQMKDTGETTLTVSRILSRIIDEEVKP